MKIRRFAAMAMASMMVLSMAACGGSQPAATTAAPAAPAATEAPKAEETKAEAAAETTAAAAEAAAAGGNIGVCIYKFDDAFMTTYRNALQEILEGKGYTVALSEAERGVLVPYAGREIDLGVRPENVLAEGDIPMKVFSNENLGMNTLVHGHIGGVEAPSNKISAKLRGWCDYKDGDTASISFGRKHFFDKQTGEAIGREAKA